MRNMKHLSAPSVLVAVGIGFANTCGVAIASTDNPQIRYEVSGPGVAEFISYQTNNGQQRAVNAKLPWSTQFTGFGGQVFVISAQGQGSISCRILIDGRSVKDATASGSPARTVCAQ